MWLSHDFSPSSHQVPGVVGTPWDTSGQAAAASSTLCKTQLGLGTHHLVMPGFEEPDFAHPAGLASCHRPGDARHRSRSPSSPGAGSGGRSCRPPLGRASSHHPHAQPPSPAVSCENKRSRSTGQGDAAGSSGKAPAPTGRQSKAMAQGERCCVGSWGWAGGGHPAPLKLEEVGVRSVQLSMPGASSSFQGFSGREENKV